MKKVYFLLYCLLVYVIMFFTIGSVKAQNTLIVDNNYNAPAGASIFSTIQAAVNAASPGDIIQVQPSPTTYGSVTINKQITLMGIGFNVNKDIPIISVMGDITLTNNASNTSDADGTVITGLQFGILYPGFDTGASYTLSNILIHNCALQYIYGVQASSYSPIDGFEVRDCYITSSVSGYGIYFAENTTNTLIRNNLILNGIAYDFNAVSSNTIANNIIYGGIYANAGSVNFKILNNNFIGATGTESAFTTELQNCEVSNNIFFGSTPSIANGGGSSSTLFQNNTFSNNIFFATGDNTIPPPGGGSGNIDGGGNAVGDPNFVNADPLNTWSNAYDFTLQAGPALNGGSDGTDIGISGGLTYFWTDPNFILNTTSVPVIEILNTSTIINQNVDLPIRVKAYSN